MDLGKDGGVFAAAPPPVSGLGNFKGVMLCNRPVDESSKLSDGDGYKPFKAMISATEGDQLGLQPLRKFDHTVKKCGPSAALKKHVKWLKELQQQMNSERDQIGDDENADAERKVKMKAFFEAQRDNVRKMMHHRNATFAANDGVDVFAGPTFAPVNQQDPVATAEARRKDAAKTKANVKPLWAMTAREKDVFEEDEGDSLIDFAENLDYEKYIGNLDFRQGLEALRDRHGKLQKEQDAFKDALVRDFNASADDEAQSTSVGSQDLEGELDGIDGLSILGSDFGGQGGGASRRGDRDLQGGDGRSDWDNSTACGDERPAAEREVKAAAERILEAAPHLKGIHSKESLQRIIERSRELEGVQPKQPFDLVDVMRNDPACAAPVIVASADTQYRLHKPVDPSSLPYLYRSPAI